MMGFEEVGEIIEAIKTKRISIDEAEKLLREKDARPN